MTTHYKSKRDPSHIPSPEVIRPMIWTAIGRSPTASGPTLVQNIIKCISQFKTVFQCPLLISTWLSRCWMVRFSLRGAHLLLFRRHRPHLLFLLHGRRRTWKTKSKDYSLETKIQVQVSHKDEG